MINYPLKIIFDSINKRLKNINNFKRKKWDNIESLHGIFMVYCFLYSDVFREIQ